MDSSEQTSLRSLREEIARLTLEIIRLSGERLALARKIGEIKARMGMPVEDQTAENDLRMRVIDFSRKNGINEDFSLKLLELLIEESKRVQQENLRGP
ncbi:chorismate mutase [Candidatus Bathyarchaeota archaeon]|nr:chorismate mutase [Candidatus Bathyarchaeota archaeon]